MPLIDPDFRNLAGPPSLDSCTRDIYAKDARFTLEKALRIALGIASAARHLHARGIMHGDLYAHNTLVNARGDSLLGDFGAASFFSPADTVRAQALQRIEVRAFACLLEELLSRCDAASSRADVVEAAWAWQARCASDDTASRPMFSDLQDALEDLLRRC
jgi:serine/threonine protein kinase